MSIESGSKNTFNNIDNIAITDLSQDITGGTNITTTGSAPIVINNDNTQNLNSSDSPSFADLTLTSNLTIPATTATTGQIKSGSGILIHNFGDNNYFAGLSTGNQSLSGCEMCAVGPFALTNVTSGISCSAFGVTALENLTTGSSCTACGHNAGRAAIGANTLTAIGAGAADNVTSGDRNTSVGASSMGTTSGSQCTSVGAFSMTSNTTGIQNCCFGDSANVGSSGLTNAMALGFNSSVSASNKVRVGNTSVTVIEGQVDWTFSSDVNMKENFVTIDGSEMLEKLSELPVASWNYKGHDKKLFRHYGPTAQDWCILFGEDAIGEFNGGVNTTINSGDISGILLVVVKELIQRNKILVKQLKIQNIKINRLYEKL